LAWGEQLDWLNEIAADGEMPRALLEQPELPPHLLFEWEAFGELSTDRQIGFGAGPIPWSAIDRYAGRHQIESDAYDRFRRLIRACDQVYLKHVTAQREKETQKQTRH
jgi:hypothetical protein